ncbi:MAG: 50S ribosomal protein L35 [Ruminococcaceae bacterium]|nr:50S ribosomal protein L35 [Oscillospiraceae bacterium]
MPKIKTHSGAKKRFTKTKSGLFKRGHTNRRHILNKKDTKRKRHLRKATFASEANAPALKLLVPYL